VNKDGCVIDHIYHVPSHFIGFGADEVTLSAPELLKLLNLEI